MNIFALSTDPWQAAQYHTDRHVVKMILESVQMLSTAVRLSGIDTGYKATHINHPSSIWVRQSLTNYLWLCDLVIALHEEWRYRFNHKADVFHKSYLVFDSLPIPADFEQNYGATPFAQAMPSVYKIEDDPVTAYRDYYNGAKRHLHQWTRREVPPFIREYDYFMTEFNDNEWTADWSPRS